MRRRDTSWFRVLGEGAVIVGSILIAFTLDAWWDDRNRKQELISQRSAVMDELRSTQEALGRARNAHDLNFELAESLRKSLLTVPDGETVVIADEDIGPLLPQVTADVSTGVLEAFIEAGGLDVVEKSDLRRELLSWSARIEDLIDDEIYLRNFAAADLATYLRANADVANAESLSVAILLSRFGLTTALDPNMLGTLTLRRERQLLNLLAARESSERSISVNLEDLLARVEKMILALKSPG